MPLRPKLRPSFSIPLAVEGEAVLDLLRDRLKTPDAPVIGQVLKRDAWLRTPRGTRSLLSPSLNLELEETDAGPRLRGRFAPHPNVWTGFMAVLMIIGLLGCAGLMYGLAQLTVRETPWGLAAVPAALGLMAFVVGGSFIGQGLSASEMCTLRRFLDEVLTDAGAFDAPQPVRR